MNALIAETPVGALRIVSQEGALVSVGWGGAAQGTPGAELLAARDQLAAYFAGRLARFDLRLRPAAPGFPAQFRAALLDIPHGETRSYGAIAALLGVSAQAIGQACGANPLPVIVPCHRVLSATGLGG